MTDSRLQELERAWKASGSLEDGVAYLHERVRTGELSQERLRLASRCGDPAAARAVGHDCTATMSPCFRCWHEISVLASVANDGGPEVALRAAIAAGRRHQARWEQVLAEAGADALSAHAWISWRKREGQLLSPSWRTRVEAALRLAEDRALDPGAHSKQELRSTLRELRAGGSFNLRWARLPLAMLLGQPGGDDWNGLRHGLDYPTLFAAIRAELAPWLLGLGDPLRARVSTRSEVEAPPQDREH